MSESGKRALGADDTGLPLHDDLLSGASAIAEFIYGPSGSAKEAEAKRRKVFHQAARRELPSFKLGGILCARKSTILKWIEEREQAA